MSDMLQIVVNKLSQLGFVDDEFRNNKEGNQEVGLQYFYKQEPNSSWEVYVSYNPHSSLMTICYHEVFGRNNSYPVAYISLNNQNDAMIACDLLESKANYLWSKNNTEKLNLKGELLGSKIKRLGFKDTGVENNIRTLKKAYSGYELTVLVESSVSLSAFLFKNRVEPIKDYPLLAVRNIHEENAVNVFLNYLTNYHKANK